MRRIKTGIGLLLWLSVTTAYAQLDSLVQTPVSYPDSIKTVLHNTRNEQAMQTGDNFAALWTSLGLDQQQKIKQQANLLRQKGAKTRPIIEKYFEVINHAVSTEGLDNTKMTGYLNVTGQVIENEALNKVLQYLKTMCTFFQTRALFYERSNQLLVTNDNYQFEYIAPPIIEEIIEETPAAEETEEPFDDWDEEPADDDWDTEWEDDDDWEEDDSDWDDDWDEEDDTWEDEPYDEATEEQMLADAITGGNILPEITGAVIRFEKVDLNFVNHYDSVFLKNTSGAFLIFSNQFVGTGGSFDWTMAGLGADSVFCTFTDYAFDVTKPTLTSESVKLTYKGRIDEPVDGIFEYKSVRHDTTTDARYPRFMSFYSNIRIRGLGEGVIYTGGFSLNGAKIISSSLLGDRSTIEIQDKTSKRLRARAKYFEFQDSTIIAQRAAIVIYQGNDSIYHPAVRLKYDYKNKYLVLQKDKGGFRDTPYSATYFKIDFNADIIRWDMKADSLDASILEARRLVPARFESTEKYNYEDYKLLEDRVYNFNPLGIAAVYADKQGMDEFYADDLARYYKKDPALIRGAMTFLAQKGLIGYNSSQGLVTMKKKGYDMFAAKFDKKDYDNITIISLTHTEPNATINFVDRSLTIRGVERFKISDSLNVIITPDSSEIKLLRNRDFTFNGKIAAGNFEYIGHNFTFKYDSFLIHLNNIDSIQFYVKQENSRGNTGRKKVNNSLLPSGNPADTLATGGDMAANMSRSSGTLFINRPNNKSGKKDIPNYPRFDSEKGSVVYFDRHEVLGGAYDQSVYFMVPPFAIDSLDGADPSAIGFTGTFVSSGMFPEFEEKLEIRPDFSLGFVHDIPAEGFRLYEGEGKLYNQLTLDNKGLRGNGTIQFLTTTLASEDFIFYPDSVTTVGKTMEIKEETYKGITFPQASVTNYKMQWLPKKDSMYIHNLGDPIQFYNNTAALNGTVIVSNKGVYGSGTLLTRGSTSKSEEMTFKHNSYSARHAIFNLESSNPEKPALGGKNVKVNFNLDENFAVISPEVEGEAAIEFPYAQFKTSITEARWDLNENKITMTKPDDVPLESSYFYTTRKDLDSLRFNASEAVYDIETSELKVSGIPYIVVADAKITPENNEVLILEDSKIGRLTNTTIILDTLNAYHRLTEGVIDIISRNEFSGHAIYQFVNALNDTIPIQMEDFHLEEVIKGKDHKKDAPELHTVANGAVTAEKNLLVSAGMYYKGNMRLFAHKPAMELSGYIKLDIKDPGYDTWIKHSSTGDQKEVVLDFDNSITEDGRKLQAGLHFSIDDNRLYSTFVEDKHNLDDDTFFQPKGILFFDKENNEFAIEDSAKVSGNTLAGRIFRYNQETKIIRFEGKVNFIPPAKDITLNAATLGKGNLKDNTFELNTFMAVDFGNVPSTAFDMMAADILDVITNIGAPEGLGDQTQLLYKLGEIIGERATRQYEAVSREEYTSLAGFAKETTVPLVLSDVNLQWSSEHHAFYSTGLIGLSNIQRTDINGAFDGFIEIAKTEGGAAILNIFIKVSASTWYYFSYEGTRLLLFSSNKNFNEVISKKSNGAKAKLGELVFAPADKAETLTFINRFRLQYYGIDEEYDLQSDIPETPVEPVKKEEKKSAKEDDEGF